jgi:hypothetical protein
MNRDSMVVALEACNLAYTESRVRSEESRAGTTAVAAGDANPQLDRLGSFVNAADVIGETGRPGEFCRVS